MSPRYFSNDISWRRHDGQPVALSLFAYDRDTIWLQCSESAPRMVRSYMLRLTPDPEGSWSPAADDKGVEIYDASHSGAFERLPNIPPVVQNSLPDALTRIAADAELLVAAGIERTRARLVEDIKGCQNSILHARKWIEKRAEKLEAEIQAIDADTKLIHIGPKAYHEIHREVIDSDIGPLILEIQDHDRFTLSKPKSALDTTDLPATAVWKAGIWKNLPPEKSAADAIERLGETIPQDRYRDFKRAAWSRLAMERHALMMEEASLEILETITLPKLLEQIEAFAATMTIQGAPAPR